MRCTNLVLSLALIGLSAPFAVAEDAKPADAAAAKAAKQAAKRGDPLFRLPPAIALGEDQKAKIEALRKEFEPKLAEVRAKGDVLTAEQKETQKKFNEEAKAAGKKGRELRAELDAKLALTAEQKKAMADAKQESAELGKTIRQRISEVLTEDQRKMLEEARKAGRKPAK